MNLDPIDVALRHVTETRNLLDTLITSSETFDYPRAKVALRELNKKARELGKLRTALEMQRMPVPANVLRLPVIG
jgi:hypothetical protein